MGSASSPSISPCSPFDRVRYVGEPVAIVAATDPETAAEAADLVEVVYESLPGVYSPEDALADGAPLVHDEGNVLVNWHLERGDVDAAFARSRRRHREHLPQSARRARLPRDRGRHRMARERRCHAANLDPGHRARGRDRRHPRIAAEPSSGDRLLHGRRFRRQGGHDRRALHRPAGLADPPPGADGLVAAGVDHGQHQAAPVHHALPHRGRPRKARSSPSTPTSSATPAPIRA